MQETQETWVWSLGQEDALEEEMATHSSIIAWRIAWPEEPGGLQFIGLQRIKLDWMTEHTHINILKGITESFSIPHNYFRSLSLFYFILDTMLSWDINQRLTLKLTQNL